MKDSRNGLPGKFDFDPMSMKTLDSQNSVPFQNIVGIWAGIYTVHLEVSSWMASKPINSIKGWLGGNPSQFFHCPSSPFSPSTYTRWGYNHFPVIIHQSMGLVIKAAKSVYVGPSRPIKPHGPPSILITQIRWCVLSHV